MKTFSSARFKPQVRLFGLAVATIVYAISCAATAAPAGTTQLALQRFHSAAAALKKPGALDTAAPVLHHIEVTGSVDATREGQFVTVALDATDNLSGVYLILVTLASPDGSQTIVQDFYANVPTTNYKVSELMGIPRYDNAVGDFNVLSEPGTWSVSEVDMADLAGNEVSYQGAQLAQLGKNTFSVSNRDYTRVTPELLAGSILTPTVSLSSAPPGTPAGSLPLVKITAQVSENLTLKFQGIDVVAAYFCLPPFENNECADEIAVFAQTGLPVQAPTTLTLSDHPTSLINPGIPAQLGTYYLMSVELIDTMSGVATYGDVMFGGQTDLSALFGGSTTVTLEP